MYGGVQVCTSTAQLTASETIIFALSQLRGQPTPHPTNIDTMLTSLAESLQQVTDLEARLTDVQREQHWQLGIHQQTLEAMQGLIEMFAMLQNLDWSQLPSVAETPNDESQTRKLPGRFVQNIKNMQSDLAQFDDNTDDDA